MLLGDNAARREFTQNAGPPLHHEQATPWRLQRPAPKLGQHTEEVLADLGYSASDIESLRSEGVV